MAGAFNQAGNNAPFVWELSADGSQPLYFSDLGLVGGSSAYGIALDSQDNAWITGLIGPGGGTPTPPQAFLLKLSSDHHIVRFRSIGGAGYDAAFGIALDSSDNAYITGETCSPTFPALIYNGSPAQGTYGGCCDAFIQKYTPSVDLEYSTFLGGRAEDVGLAIDVTGDGVAYVTGYTTAYFVGNVCCVAATDFPAVATMQGFSPYGDLIDPVNCPGGACHFDNMVQAFVTKVNASGSQFLVSSFLGGDPVFTTISAYGPQGFPAKIDDNDLPVIFIPGISASELDRQDTGAESWLNIGGIHHEELALYPDRANPQMVVPDVLRRIMAGPIQLNSLSRLTYSFFIHFMESAGYREYDVARDPNRRTYAGCDLSQRTTTAPNFFTHRPAFAAGEQVDRPTAGDQRFDVTLSGVASLVISDTLGNSTLPISDTVMPGIVPGATHMTTGPTSHQIVLAGDGDYALTFQATDEPLVINLTHDDGSGIGQATRYRDLVLPAGTAARLLVGPTTPGALAYDGDADGTFETPVTPTALASGAAAADVIAPVITFGSTDAAGRDPAAPNLQSVTITAQDPDSGVQNLYYSLDGETYRPVTGTLSVDPDVTPVVYAFADDTLANRAPSRAFHVPNPNQPDLALAMSHPGPTPATGVLAYTLTVSNTGSSEAAETVTITDSLPVSTTLVSATGTGWDCTPSAGAVTCTHPGPVAPGAALPDLALSLQATPGALPAAVNEATVATPGDWNPANDYVLDESPVQPVVDLALAISSSDLFPEGGTGVYSLTVSNLGSFPATGVVTVTDSLPTGLTFAGQSGEGWTCAANGQDVTCGNSEPLAGNGGTLPALALSVSIDGAAYPSVTNTASVSSSANADADLGNNSATEETPIDRPANVSLYKSHMSGENPRPFQVGTDDFYDIYVSSAGPADASSPITVTDTLPAGLAFVSASGQDWICNGGGQLVTCSHPGPLAPFNSLPGLQLTVHVAIDAAAAVTNTATVSVPGLDPALDNNTWRDPTRITWYADLGLVKSHSADFVAGSVGVYTLHVTNYGLTSREAARRSPIACPMA